MTFKEIFKKWRQLVIVANDRGVPLPMVRDPQTLEGSVSLTLVCMSSFLVIVGIVGKAAGLIGGIDMNSAFNFFYASTTLYFGHSWVHKELKDEGGKKGSESAQKADDPDAQ
jgi:hypothetical protein